MEALAQLEKRITALIGLTNELREQRDLLLEQSKANSSQLHAALERNTVLAGEVARYEQNETLQAAKHAGALSATELEAAQLMMGGLISDIDRIIDQGESS
jgi:hypothetical protein